MHELAITEQMLQIALTACTGADGRAITGIYLVIGELTSVVDDSVQFYFDILSQDTLAAGARLHFQRESAIATCADCGAQWPVCPPIAPVCPYCQGAHIRVTGGRDFRVVSIDIEEKAGHAS